MNKLEIIECLHESFEGKPWYGNSLSTYLQEIHADMLNFSIGGGHSIGQIIEHMIYWRELVTKRLKNHTEVIIGDDSGSEWPCKTYPAEMKNTFFAQIRATQKELILNIERSDESLLNKTVPGKDYTFTYLIKGVIDHDIYHLGQLYYLISAAKKANENSRKDD